jgi:hypothetical protein
VRQHFKDKTFIQKIYSQSTNVYVLQLFFTTTQVGRFFIILLVKLLPFQFGAHIINIEMILVKPFCGKIPIFCPRGAIKVANVKFPSLRIRKRHFDCHPIVQTTEEPNSKPYAAKVR